MFIIQILAYVLSLRIKKKYLQVAGFVTLRKWGKHLMPTDCNVENSDLSNLYQSSNITFL